VKWQFFAKNPSYFSLPTKDNKSILKNKACFSILIKESNYCPQRVSDG
jgi:hypothetical protein